MKTYGIKCPECKDVIFSRAKHDLHYCTCGKVFVDGGFVKLVYGGDCDIFDKIEKVEVDIGDEMADYNLTNLWFSGKLDGIEYGIKAGRIKGQLPHPQGGGA